MGDFFGKILKGPIDSLLGSVGDIIDNLHMSGEEKAKAKIRLAELQNDFALKVMEADYRFAEYQAQTIQTEMASNSWLARSWRPMLMLTFNYIILHVYVLAPLFNLPVIEIPPDMWDLLKIGVGGYIVGRSAEKVIPTLKGGG